MLAQAFLAQGKEEDARTELDAARALATASQNRLVRFQYDLSFARVLLGSAQPKLSRPQPGKTLKDAREHGFVGVEFEARLVLAEWEKKKDTTRRRESNLQRWRVALAASDSASRLARRRPAEPRRFSA